MTDHNNNNMARIEQWGISQRLNNITRKKVLVTTEDKMKTRCEFQKKDVM